MNKIAPELENVRSVAIAGHMRPDGDCVGACMGLYLYIKDNFPHIDVQVYLEKIPVSYNFIKGTEDICSDFGADKEYDLFIGLDSGDRQRYGDAVKYLDAAKRSICIDHHISNNGYADVNHIVPGASSTSELIYELLDEEKITNPIAEALYMGIAHDTGVFQYTCTSPRTMEIGGKLIGKGIPFTKILDDTYYKKTYVQNQITGRALMESILLLHGTCIASSIRMKDMEFYGVDTSDLDGIVSQLRNTKGVEVAIFLYEIKAQEFKVSMRSNEIVDVQEVASYFGGGGHVRAAGCTMQGSIYDVLNNLTRRIEIQLKAWENKK